LNEIWSLATKDLRLLLRDRMDMFFTLVFPLCIAMFFGTVFGGSGGGEEPMGLPIAVVDEDQSEVSRAFVASLGADGEFQMTPAASREEGTARVRRGAVDACVIVPGGFGNAAEGIFSGEPAKIEAVVDPSKRATAGMLQGLLTKHAFQQTFGDFSKADKMRARAQKSLAKLRGDPEVPPQVRGTLEPFLSSLDTLFKDLPAAIEGGDGTPKGGKVPARAGWEPVRVEMHSVEAAQGSGPPSAYAVSFPQAVIWGVMGCALSFGISLTTERSSGTLTRLMLSPLARWHILAGKGLACFLTTVGVSALLLGFGALVFRVYPVDTPMLVVSVLCIAFGFVGVMMLLACLSRTAGGAAGLGRATMLVLAMIGGGSIPLFLMPRWMRAASGISPFKWAVEALDGAIWRGLSPADMALPLGILVAVGAVGFAVGARVFSWSSKT
jgi:ABC-2 type transport system permease protein